MSAPRGGTAVTAAVPDDAKRDIVAPKWVSRLWKKIRVSCFKLRCLCKRLCSYRGVIILPKATVPKETELKGEITIGPGTVLHPSARILAETGPIVLGEGNIIEERVKIRNRFPPGPDGTPRTLYIGSKNLFEAYSVIEGCVGNNNSVQCKAKIGPKTTLSTGCVIGTMCHLLGDETIAPNTIIMGDPMERRTAEVPQAPPFMDEHVEFLQKQLPTFHFIIKSSI